MSLASIGIGSVGTSPLPILVTTFSTSGNCVLRICAAFWVLAIVVFKLLPVKTLVSTAKSPSSNAGINSPPNVVNIKTAKMKNAITDNKTVLGKLTTLLNAAW